MKKTILIILGITVPILTALFVFIYFYLPVSEVLVNERYIELTAGEQKTDLVVSIEPFFLQHRNLDWHSDNSQVAVVSRDGIINAKEVGIANITVSAGNTASTIQVVVFQREVAWNGGTYYGDLMGNIPHGIGEWLRDDGYHYEGQYNNGQFHGKGILTFPNGDIYDGYFKDDVYHGEGTMKYISGASYTGGWKHGVEDGMGTLTFQNGITYEGGFKDGEHHGFGTINWPNGTIFRGEFVNDNKHGTGEMIMPDGTSLMGVYNNDELTHGVWTYPDGTRSATGPEQWRIYE